jgi:hypothetical protein
MTSQLPRTPGAAAPIGAPWFVQFWPVFIAVLMAVSVLASLATVVIAYRHADVDVRIGERNGRVVTEAAATTSRAATGGVVDEPSR